MHPARGGVLLVRLEIAIPFATRRPAALAHGRVKNAGPSGPPVGTRPASGASSGGASPGDRYFQPPSKIMPMIVPVVSDSATCTHVCMTAPDEGPTKMPSSSARRRDIATAWSLVTTYLSSSSRRSRTGGTNPSLRLRSPSMWSPGTGSQPMTLIGRACSLKRRAHPVRCRPTRYRRRRRRLRGDHAGSPVRSSPSGQRDWRGSRTGTACRAGAGPRCARRP